MEQGPGTERILKEIDVNDIQVIVHLFDAAAKLGVMKPDEVAVYRAVYKKLVDIISK